ncbi:MAG: phosphatidic acid phosphatase [Lachnospiraceae bacterium]|nr:phosphatidic acid phosphatase [Lachnospiraceae bacterium]
MKKPMVDYRKFRLSKINDPEFSHLKLLLGWVGYFALYFITENFIPTERCYVVHCWLDDVIPFNEVFVIPYVFWYLLIVVSLLYLALYNVDNFKNLMTFIIITQVVAMAIYIAFPNRQDLRPVEFPRDNVLSQLVGLLYSFDTNTNVCPSLHVAYSLGIASTWLKEKSASVPWKVFVVIAVILICLSTAFIKQHSVVDAFVAIPVCILAEIIVFGKSYWKPRLKKVLTGESYS